MIYKNRNTGQVIRTTGRVTGDIWELQAEPKNKDVKSAKIPQDEPNTPPKMNTAQKAPPKKGAATAKKTPKPRPAKGKTVTEVTA